MGAECWMKYKMLSIYILFVFLQMAHKSYKKNFCFWTDRLFFFFFFFEKREFNGE